MLSFTGGLKIFLSRDPVDLRKSFDGLSGLTREIFKEDPEKGALFVFTNRRRNRIKILYWDRTGQWVLAKRLEMGTFSWPRSRHGSSSKIVLSPEALVLLLDGVDLRGGELRPWYQRN